MAVLGIRTGWGPQATADRRAHELAMTEKEERLALEKEKTKQITKGDAAVAAAVMGYGLPVEPPMLDFSDPTVQIGLGAVAIGLAYAAKRYMG